MHPRSFRFFLVAVFAAISIFFSACSSDDPASPPVDNEHAPPTTLTITLVKLDTGGNPGTDTSRATVRDTSVVKGKPRVEGLLDVEAGAMYAGSITLLDESKSVAEDVTVEIRNEKDGHLFLFTAGSGIEASRVGITNKDKDSKGGDVGLTFTLTVTAGSSAVGALNVQLRHYDSGNKNDSVFDTDINIDMPMRIR